MLKEQIMSYIDVLLDDAVHVENFVVSALHVVIC